MNDFSHLLVGLNKNFYGLVDQLVAAKGRTFVGVWWSTFTGYINRIRGYHSQLEKAEGYETGKINSYYYVGDKYAHREYRSISAFECWAREFPVGWRDIDKGLDLDL